MHHAHFAFFISSRATCSRVVNVINHLSCYQDVRIDILCAGSLLEPGSIDALNTLPFCRPNVSRHDIYSSSTTDDPSMQARVFSSICHSLAFYVANTPPFALIVTGDRFETLAASVSAAYSHIKLIHIQGGEISGNIDNKVRYATTSLADVHIACSTIAFDRLIRLGIHSDRVRFFGCPSIDLIYEDNSDISLWEHTYPDLMRLISNPYLICINHPDTENRHGNLSNARHLSKALSKTKVGKLIVQGNADAGFSSASIVEFDNVTHNDYIFVDNLPYKLFLHCLRRCSCIVGNSSVAFREAAVLGIPAINLGQRQDDRDTFHNILSLSYDCPDLHERILSHSANRFASTTVFGLGDAGTKIANFLYSLLSDESQS